jgi:hypothetical protein
MKAKMRRNNRSVKNREENSKSKRLIMANVENEMKAASMYHREKWLSAGALPRRAAAK